MNIPQYALQLAGHALPFRTRYADTCDYFRAYGKVLSMEQQACQEIAGSPVPVHIPDIDWREYLQSGMEDCPHTEYSMLTPHFSDALLPFDRVILHAVAIRWEDMAWLLCGESGVGKSTQARFLQELRPGEFTIICGDRPILSFHDNEILVHPSPWNGKENWHGADAAPLSGIILLKRGEENRLACLSEKEAALQLYPHFIHTAWKAENIHMVAELETRMLDLAPVWQLTSHDVPASTRLLLESVF